MKALSLLITGLLLTAAVSAAAPPADSSTDAAAAFAKLKTLAGDWEANTDMGKSHLRYEVISGGNSVVEHETMGNEPEMLTVYYLDGNRLLLTHYCTAGNQPRMQASGFDAQSGELRFQFLDATNLAGPGAGHMHNVTLHFVDNNHFSADWQFFENGQQKFSEKAQYTRAK
jgi:hypothetical protein